MKLFLILLSIFIILLWIWITILYLVYNIKILGKNSSVYYIRTTFKRFKFYYKEAFNAGNDFLIYKLSNLEISNNCFSYKKYLRLCYTEIVIPEFPSDDIKRSLFGHLKYNYGNHILLNYFNYIKYYFFLESEKIYFIYRTYKCNRKNKLNKIKDRQSNFDSVG